MTIFQVFQARVSTSVQYMKCTAITDENIKSVWVFDLQHPATGKFQSCYCTRLTLKPFDCRRSCWTCSVAIKVADVFILINIDHHTEAKFYSGFQNISRSWLKWSQCSVLLTEACIGMLAWRRWPNIKIAFSFIHMLNIESRSVET